MLTLLEARGRLPLCCVLALALSAGNTVAAEKRAYKAEPIDQRTAADVRRRVAPERQQRQPVAPERIAPERVTRPSAQQRTWDFGCAADHYPASQRLARQIKLRMPVPANELLGVIPEPGVIHSDPAKPAR